jgi:hypothetical protein
VGDDYTIHDLERLITFIDGREKTVEEIAVAVTALGADVIQAGTALIGAEDFMAGLSGHRPVDVARQGCLAGLRRKLADVRSYL